MGLDYCLGRFALSVVLAAAAAAAVVAVVVGVSISRGHDWSNGRRPPLSTVNTSDKHTANSTTGPLGPGRPRPSPSPPARQLLFKYTKHATGQLSVSERLGVDLKSYYCSCLLATDAALRILHQKHQDPLKPVAF